jgi:hypothetical protein
MYIVWKRSLKLTGWITEQLLGSNRLPMIDLLLQLAYVAVVLAVISLFVCALPVWLIVLVVILILRWLIFFGGLDTIQTPNPKYPNWTQRGLAWAPNKVLTPKRRPMYERSNIPVSKSVEEQSWWDIETSGGRGLDSVTLYRGFYVEIDNSPDMPLIWLGINTGFDSGTYCYEEYPKDTPLNLIKTEGLMKVDRLIAAPKLRLVWPLIELAVVRVKSTDRSPD